MDSTGPAEVSLPVACTLGPADGAARSAQWARLLARHGAGQDRAPGKVVVWFDAADGVATELKGLVDEERECCAFLDWDLVGPAGSRVGVQITGNEPALAGLSLAT